ncbi:NAD(P)-binding protein [Laetiporus sulphureus 93-53]|uniref:NAD(P)-binding protein n=1 Tax=Laetiporus sulphureus 93-53 TaxID=1314785 RepID=A0A165ETS7_9APHY|nr:NAD(P)-binding protein [Laetiporus sulphureus 93-53]KZT07744.1 NAD(P)-binding protein [Laetiporus sulphureus 93-53]
MPTLSAVRRVAIITGASQGIGWSIALRLAEDGLAAAVNDVPSKRKQLDAVVAEIKDRGSHAVAITADVSQEEDVRSMVAETAEQLGGLDMVANAGIASANPIINTSAEEWDRVMSVNARGVFFSYQYAAKQMIGRARDGRIIGFRSIGAYSASKFAVRGLTQTAELAQHKITVNAYAPGMIYTPMSPDFPVAEPEVIASLVSYLSKPESYFITGKLPGCRLLVGWANVSQCIASHTISVNGGVLFD